MPSRCWVRKAKRQARSSTTGGKSPGMAGSPFLAAGPGGGGRARCWGPCAPLKWPPSGHFSGRDSQRSERIVHPLGLVVKNQVWYLVAGTAAGQRTFPVSRVLSVERTNDAVQRPQGFDLAAAWRAIVTSLDERRAPATVHVRTDAETLDILRYMFGTRPAQGPA